MLEFTRIFRGKIDSVRAVSSGEIWQQFRIPLDESRTTRAGYLVANLYNCVPYLAPASLLLPARVLGSPPILLMYLARFANLIAFVTLTWLGLRLLPDFRLALAAIALMPMTLHQAASVSADSLTFAGIFLLLAYIVRLAYEPMVEHVGLPQLFKLALLIGLTASTKFSPWAVLLVLLVPGRKFTSPRIRWIAVSSLLALGLGIGAFWQVVNEPNLIVLKRQRLDVDVNVETNVKLIRQNPGGFLKSIGRTFLERHEELTSEFVGKFGWLSVEGKPWVVPAYLILLLLAAGTRTGDASPGWIARILIAVLLAVGICLLFVALWTLEARSGYRSLFERDSAACQVPGIQGRYFIPFAFPLLLLLTWRKPRLPAGAFSALAFAVIAICNVSSLGSILERFYTPR
jgi:uncharacterized membrane protein